jgi:hypothetical protein
MTSSGSHRTPAERIRLLAALRTAERLLQARAASQLAEAARAALRTVVCAGSKSREPTLIERPASRRAEGQP